MSWWCCGAHSLTWDAIVMYQFPRAAGTNLLTAAFYRAPPRCADRPSGVSIKNANSRGILKCEWLASFLQLDLDWMGASNAPQIIFVVRWGAFFFIGSICLRNFDTSIKNLDIKIKKKPCSVHCNQTTTLLLGPSHTVLPLCGLQPPPAHESWFSSAFSSV